MANSLNRVNRFRLGLSNAFGRGMDVDDAGNIYFDILEVMGHRIESIAYAFTPDTGKYGEVKLSDPNIALFEDNQVYWDSDSNPDYKSNWENAPEFNMYIFIENECCYICDSLATKDPTTITLARYPIIKDYNNVIDEKKQRIYVVNSDNSVDYDKNIYITWNSFATEIDRIGNLAYSDLTIAIKDISGASVSLGIGQKIIADYCVYTHTDSLRDRNAVTYWSTQDGNADSYVLIDLAPNGVQSTLWYNNIELLFRNIAFPVGPYEYILQGIDTQANNLQRYKTISSGYLPAKQEGASHVIKFDPVDYRYLKLVLIGTPNEEYYALDCTLGHSSAEITTDEITGTIDLSTNKAGEVLIDGHSMFCNFSEYNTYYLNALNKDQIRSIFNFHIHKNYILSEYGLSYLALSGDSDPTTGVLLPYSGNFGLNYSGNSIGLDFGSNTSANFFILRDKNQHNVVVDTSGYDIYGSYDNTSYLPLSGSITDQFSNGYGTDLVLSDFSGDYRYYKVNYTGSSFSGDFINDLDLLITPSSRYLNIVDNNFDKNDRLKFSSPTTGITSYAGLDCFVSGEWGDSLFNDLNVSYGGFYLVSGQNLNISQIYDPPAYSGQITVDDFYLLNVIPYYADMNDINKTVEKGIQISVAEMQNDNTGKFYVPSHDNSGVEERSDYRLVYYNIRYGTRRLYQGIPALTTINGLRNNVISIRESANDRENTLAPIDNILMSLMTYDILKDTIVVSSERLKLRFNRASDISIYAINVNDDVAELLSPIFYTYDADTGYLTMASTFSTSYPSHYVAAQYEYPIYKDVAPLEEPGNHVTFIQSKYEQEKIQLSGVKVYPTQYFKDYLVNDETSVFEFTINPETWEQSTEDGATLVKVLDGGYRKDTVSYKSRASISVTAPKITKEMADQLVYWSQQSEVLGLVDDMLIFREVYISPNSLKMTRRKTSALEQQYETSSYSYNLEFKEV